jgi:hypothetical protein
MNGDYRRFDGERCVLGCYYYARGSCFLYGHELKFTNFYPLRCNECLDDKFVNDIEEDD